MAFDAAQVVDQPGQALGLVLKLDHLQVERLALERAANNHQIGTELILDVSDDPIVSCCCRRQYRDLVGQGGGDAPDSPVIGAKVMSPVGDAMSLVDDEEPDPAPDCRQGLALEAL